GSSAESCVHAVRTQLVANIISASWKVERPVVPSVLVVMVFNALLPFVLYREFLPGLHDVAEPIRTEL
ncbi:hypothetical protein J4Q44_G00098210, partial [Coregonus suidteri]